MQFAAAKCATLLQFDMPPTRCVCDCLKDFLPPVVVVGARTVTCRRKKGRPDRTRRDIYIYTYEYSYAYAMTLEYYEINGNRTLTSSFELLVQ